MEALKLIAGLLNRHAGVSWRAVALSMLFPAASAENQVEAYWGSFGERNGRIEGVFVKSGQTGVFLGFDEESETGVFSTEVEWSPDGQFVFEGVSMASDSTVLTPTNGVGRTLGQGGGVLLESGFGESDLRFKAFVKSGATFKHYDLEGEIGGEIYVVLGSEDLSYALCIDGAGTMLRGELQEASVGTESVFLSSRGDRFVLRDESSRSVYALADGRRGSLRGRSVSAGLETETTPAHLSSVWSAFTKPESGPADALHFIVDGDGALGVALSASVELDIRENDWLSPLSAGMVIELYQQDREKSWQPLNTSLPLSRMKAISGDQFSIRFAGVLPVSLNGGTYLVQLAGLVGLAARVEVEAEFDPSSQARAVNGSSLYHRGRQSSDHQFGFELEGDGVVRALIRSVGPGLDYFEISDCTADPALTVYQNELKSWINEDWAGGSAAAQIADWGERMGAFPLREQSRDAALLLSLGRGSYSVDSGSQLGDEGFEIVEVYLSAESPQ